MDGLGQPKGLRSFIPSLWHLLKVVTQGNDFKGHYKHTLAPPQLPDELGFNLSFQNKGDLLFTYFLQLAEVCRGNNPDDPLQLGLPLKYMLNWNISGRWALQTYELLAKAKGKYHLCLNSDSPLWSGPDHRNSCTSPRVLISGTSGQHVWRSKIYPKYEEAFLYNQGIILFNNTFQCI